ncbi:MAG: acyl-CoA dehydrogenase family protein [Dehalococcoidia bacterium]|nr:acyl-CoA dehydrogenase family protein [Dehalococcoidia bacterium]
MRNLLLEARVEGAGTIPARPGDLVAAARAVAPRVSALAPQIDADRAIPAELLDAFAAAGFFRMAVPRSLGGLETDPITVATVVEELAAADASAAWCVMLANQAARSAGFLAAEGARELFAAPGAVVAGVLRARGRAVPAEGGYVVTGRWPFASGSNHATWFGAECVVMDGETPHRDDNGQLQTIVALLPRTSVSVHDTWDTGALRGTGSNDFSACDVFVPASRTHPTPAAQPRHPWAMYRATVLAYITHGTHALGVARAAFEATRDLALAKVAYGTVLLAEKTRFQAELAEAQALIESARAYLYGSAAQLWAMVQSGAATTPQDHARVRLATSNAVRASVEAVNRLYAAAGTSAFFTDSPLERRFRDIHAAAAHIMVGTGTYEAAGRVALGMEAGMPYFEG